MSHHPATHDHAKILLVDDDRRLIQALQAKLTSLGCQCLPCSNVSEALSHFAVGGIDLIITDLTMPGIDGLGFIGLIRSQSNVPVIIITGRSDTDLSRSNGILGAHVLRKPFTLEQLSQRVISLIPKAAPSFS
ncbi:MAG TPA: response regulator [Phycisphaerae bacterium]